MVREAHIAIALAAFAGAVAANGQTTATLPIDTAEFRIESVKDPIDDKVSMYAFVGDEKHFVALGCDAQGAGTVRVLLKFPDYIGDGRPGLLAGGTEVQFRFDDAPAQSSRWYSDKDIVSTGENASPDKFAAGISRAQRVYVRATSQWGNQSEMGFQFPNSGETIAKVLDYCGADAPR